MRGSYATATIWDINPEPWRSPGIPRRGQPAPKDGKLEAYQTAIKEMLEGCEPRFDERLQLSVTFYFWRSTRKGQPCDTTNMQKATEDAIQGVLIHNDKMDHHVQSFLMDQGPEVRPCVHIVIQPFEKPRHDDINLEPPPEQPRLFEGNDWDAPEEEMF